MDERERVTVIIRNLANKTVEKGCTEAEALSAARKVGELLKVYNLTMDEIFINQSDCITLTINTHKENKSPIDNVCVAIAKFCDCKVWHTKEKHNLVYKYFGFEYDTQMAKYLFDTIDSAMNHETLLFKMKSKIDPKYKGVHGRRLNSSFQKGMIVRVHERLMELANQRKREEKEKMQVTTTGTSLVVVKEKKVQTEFEKLGMKLRKSQSARRSVHYPAYASGKEAADKVNLSRPLGNNIPNGFLGK